MEKLFLDRSDGLVVDLASTLAIAAAQLSHAHRLHTLDADFRGLGGDIELIKKLG